MKYPTHDTITIKSGDPNSIYSAHIFTQSKVMSQGAKPRSQTPQTDHFARTLHQRQY